MIDEIITKTNEYIKQMPKDERKLYGQFFTSKETAIFMASLFNFENKTEISILDAGAGSGILTIAFLEKAILAGIKTINLTCYENDKKVIPLLNSNIELFIKHNKNTKIKYNLITENYITSLSDDFNANNNNAKKYDYVIGNPPYLKIPKDAIEALSMPSVCYGAPNLYFLFAAMSLFNLQDEGELVYIIPRSWTSGAYFKSFRDYFLSIGKLQNIHLFVSRDKVFKEESVLQETMILKIKKTTKKPKNVLITSTDSNNDFNNIQKLKVPYDIVVSGNEKYVYLPTNEKELQTLSHISKFQNTLISLGLKMKTGLTVDFREPALSLLRNENNGLSIPLFYAQHIQNGKVVFPIHKENEYIMPAIEGLTQENKNYLFVKRFTSKEEKRRLQCGIYLASEHKDYIIISTHNKINFIDSAKETDTIKPTVITDEIVYGLYCLFNSSLYDSYYRILNGSTQVNSTEINNMPIPDLSFIKRLGKKLIKLNDLSVKKCDELLEEEYVKIR